MPEMVRSDRRSDDVGAIAILRQAQQEPRMEQYGNLQILGHLQEIGDDLVDDKQIRAFLPAPGIVEHQSPFSDSSCDIWDAVQVEQWKFIRHLKYGGFGRVQLEEKIFERFPQPQGSRPQLRAVKIIEIVRESDGGLRIMHHLPELSGMAKFSKFGASFIQLFAWFRLASEICIAMEWAPYGDLEDCVLKPLPEAEVQEIVRQISLAVVIMHERRFLHRDLKPKNVFVFRKQPWRVKLGDFGVSKRVRDGAFTSWHTSIEAECSAPEVLGLLGGDYTEESSYASPVDMWSLGYLTHWLLTTHYPLTRFALPRYCMVMDPVPLSELENMSVSNQAVDFVKNLLHLIPANRMTAQEAYSHPWLTLPTKGSIPSLEHSIISYPLQQARRRTSAMSNDISGRYGMPHSAESPESGTSNPTFQTFGHRPLLPPSGYYRDSSQAAPPFLTNSDHQIEYPSGNNRSGQVPDLEETQEELVPLTQKRSKAEMQEPARAKIQEAVQYPREQREDRNAHSESEKQQRGRKVLQSNTKDEQEEKAPGSAELIYNGKTMNIVQPIAESRKNTDIQPKSDAERIAAMREAIAKKMLKDREEEYRKGKAVRKQAIRSPKSESSAAILKRLEELTAAKDANLKEAERRGEEEEKEEEARREEEREFRKVSGSANEIESLFKEARSGNDDEIGGLGGVDSEASDFAATLPQYDLENLNGEREGNARYKMPPEEPDDVERMARRSFEKFTAFDRDEKLSELMQFSKTFTLKKPPPGDLISILARDPAKQEAIKEAILDSYRKQAEDNADIPLLYPQRQLENTKHLSKSMSGSQQKNVEPHPKQSGAQSWAKIVASGVQGQQPAQKASTDNEPFKKQKRRRKKRGANGGYLSGKHSYAKILTLWADAEA